MSIRGDSESLCQSAFVDKEPSQPRFRLRIICENESPSDLSLKTQTAVITTSINGQQQRKPGEKWKAEEVHTLPANNLKIWTAPATLAPIVLGAVLLLAGAINEVYTKRSPKSSSAKTVEHAMWNISYSDGSSASGNIYADVVTIGNVSIPRQAVELAETLSSSFQQNDGSDGLLGLAWPVLNTITPEAQATLVENITWHE
ncbi:Asp-domain-containing protein [Athelia psychrophila]|uniref:Asp-domain-containing protein n=1 Tax=Athelia psychrophila TaxID=1759441 RepID=A0A166PSR1_9AGAM|nr:Asp-domain-containing protein [Fibularhizoctonia sp. CBS 109695]